ncbi:MAG: hypothetical protein WCP85_21495 [Mariniphaga sp.]
MSEFKEKEEEIDENSLEWAKKFKKYLRFDVGDVVYLKSDLKRKCPMVVSTIAIFDDYHDYYCDWTTSQLNVESRSFKDKALTT